MGRQTSVQTLERLQLADFVEKLPGAAESVYY
jgi:hypothetical protein